MTRSCCQDLLLLRKGYWCTLFIHSAVAMGGYCQRWDQCSARALSGESSRSQTCGMYHRCLLACPTYVSLLLVRTTSVFNAICVYRCQRQTNVQKGNWCRAFSTLSRDTAALPCKPWAAFFLAGMSARLVWRLGVSVELACRSIARGC